MNIETRSPFEQPVSESANMSILVPIEAAGDRARFGGKASNLAFLVKLGLAVPEARVVPADEFVAACANGPSDNPLRPELVAALRAVVTELGGRVSVRSSATLEDARTHSFAGQFATILNVGPDGVEAAVRAVWASVFTENVRAYLRRADLDPTKLRMAVVIQRQIVSAASGVAMGASNGTIVEAVFGQGEGLVSGAISADHWEVSGRRIATARYAMKASRIDIPAGVPTGETVHVNLAGADRTKPSLTDAQVLEVTAACATIEAACDGRKQDCEFAFADGKLYLLQTRDVTASLPVIAPPIGEFKAPGKGAWNIDTNHFSRPTPPLFQEVFRRQQPVGFKIGAQRYGLVVSHLDVEFVNGYMYTRLRPLAAPEDAQSKPPPPAFIFKLLVKLVPALRRRVKAAETVWSKREWRAQLDEWETDKARAIAEHRRLQAVDLDALDDAELAAHFEATYKHAENMVAQHHTYTLTNIIPTGDLLCHVSEWSGGTATDADILAMLAGASPLTADLSSEESRSLGATLASSSIAKEALRLDVAGEPSISEQDAVVALASLRTLPGVDEFLAMREFRLVEGIDPGSPCLRECPNLLWQALRSTALAKPAGAANTESLERVRALVPTDKHAELDALITEARAVAAIRDERALYSDVWAWGIFRTTVIAMGRRIIKRNPSLLITPTDLVMATADEIRSLFLRSEGPSALELETREAHRRAYTTRDAPSTLGPKELPPPSPALLPPNAGRVLASVLRCINHVLAPPAEASDAGMLGKSASSGVWEGPVHVVNSHDDARDIPAGAVLVVGSSSSSFTMLAPLASAVVAEGGGLLSHVAIVCREYRIPCVCGVAGVMETLHTGQRVRVDGTRGVVELLS